MITEDTPSSKTSSVVASLKFIEWQSLYEKEKPFQVFLNLPPDATDKRTTNLVFEDIFVEVTNVRSSEDNFSLDRNGFEYLVFPTQVKDFDARQTVEEYYLPEVESMLRQNLGSTDIEIFFFDWRVRLLILGGHPRLMCHSEERMPRKLKVR